MIAAAIRRALGRPLTRKQEVERAFDQVAVAFRAASRLDALGFPAEAVGLGRTALEIRRRLIARGIIPFENDDA